jgi:hypothetical protein
MQVTGEFSFRQGWSPEGNKKPPGISGFRRRLPQKKSKKLQSSSANIR